MRMKTMIKNGIMSLSLAAILSTGICPITTQAEYKGPEYECDECGYFVDQYVKEGCDSKITLHTWVQPYAEGNRSAHSEINRWYFACVDQETNLVFEIQPLNYQDTGMWTDHEMWTFTMNVENGNYAISSYGGALRSHVGSILVLNSNYERGPKIGYDGTLEEQYGEILTLENEELVAFAMYGTPEWIDENIDEYSAWAKEYDAERIAQQKINEEYEASLRGEQVETPATEEISKEPVVEIVEPEVAIITDENNTETKSETETKNSIPGTVAGVIAVVAILAIAVAVFKKR